MIIRTQLLIMIVLHMTYYYIKLYVMIHCRPPPPQRPRPPVPREHIHSCHTLPFQPIL